MGQDRPQNISERRSMANPFDQFDQQHQAQAANPFDQFGGGVQPKKAQQPDTKQGGIGQNLVAGLKSGLADVVGIPQDLPNWLGRNNPGDLVGDAILRGLGFGQAADKINATTEKIFPKNPVMGGQWLQERYPEALGGDPGKVPANTFGEKVARGVGYGLPTAIIPGKGGLTAASVAKDLATLGTATAGAEAAVEAAPEGYKPLAGLLGALAGGIPTAAGLEVLSSAGRGLKRAAEPFQAGMGKAIPDDISQISPDALAAINPKATQGAARVLSQGATDPGQALADLATGPSEIVTGSKPTTFQQTGDMGIGSLERGAATKRPDLFRARAADQNSARVAALGDIQQAGNPNDVASYFNSQFRDMDAQTATHIDDLVTQARVAGEGVGGAGVPEAYGERIRDAIQTAENATRKREGDMWSAIDPDGNLTGNVFQTKVAASDLAKALPQTAKPMAGEEAAIFDAAQSLPTLAPVSDLIALRSRVSTEMRNELVSNGRSPAYARLSQLRGAIQDNLSHTIGEKVANESAAVARGLLPQEDTIASRLKDWQDEFYRSKAATGSISAESPGAPPTAGATEAASPHGAELSPEAGPGSAAVDQGLPDDVGGLTPTFDDAAKQRLAEATAATKERARTFGVAPVSTVTAKAGPSDIYKLPEAKVPGRFFHPGPTGFHDMQSLYKAVGNQAGTGIIQDYAASSLRKAAMKEDGTLDPVQYSRWRSQHSDALRALPDDVQQRFSTASDAAQAVNDATRLREAAIKEAQTGAVSKVMNAQTPEEVTSRIGAIFGSKSGVSDMGAIARAAQTSPAAREGLRKAMADYISNKFISNTEAATSGQNIIRADQFQTFVKQNKPILRQVFTNDEINTLQAIADDINRAKRSETAVKLPGGSNTAQDIYATNKDARGRSFLRLLMDSTGASIGASIGSAAGPFGSFIGATTGAIGGDLLNSLRTAGLDRVDQLVSHALLHPEVARKLLQVAPAKATSAAYAPLSRILRRSVKAGSIADVAAMQGDDSKKKATP
jgi:hypothetical protein